MSKKDMKLTLTIKYPSRELPDGYLLLTMSDLVPNDGETWLRGEDAGDGSFNKETRDRILRNINNYIDLGVRDD